MGFQEQSGGVLTFCATLFAFCRTAWDFRNSQAVCGVSLSAESICRTAWDFRNSQAVKKEGVAFGLRAPNSLGFQEQSGGDVSEAFVREVPPNSLGFQEQSGGGGSTTGAPEP